jgi:hypothetical protein
MEQVSYEAVEPFWVEWKRSSRPRTEPEENRRLSIMKNIFLAVAGHQCGAVDDNALEFVRSRVPEWQESLRKHSEDYTSVLFRGIVDIQAIEARTTGYTLSVGVPISFAFSESQLVASPAAGILRSAHFGCGTAMQRRVL